MLSLDVPQLPGRRLGNRGGAGNGKVKKPRKRKTSFEMTLSILVNAMASNATHLFTSQWLCGSEVQT